MSNIPCSKHVVNWSFHFNFQLLNYILLPCDIFSLYPLHGLIEDDQLKCWQLFVQASRLLCTPMITIEDAEKGHEVLLDFCNTFELLHGSTSVTPNMHLHTHLLNCIKRLWPYIQFLALLFRAL